MAPITPEGREFLRDREADFLSALEAIKAQHAEQLTREREQLRAQAERLDHRYRIVTYGLILMVLFSLVGGVVATAILSSQSDRIADRATEAKQQSDRLVELQGGLRDITLFARQTSVQNQNALCAVRHDFEQRVAASDKFLREHPEGFAGIPAAQLRQSTNGQRRTIQALSGLVCR